MDNFVLPANFNAAEFRQLANGFFQAEGSVSVHWLYLSPIIVLMAALPNKESLDFFLPRRRRVL